MTRHSLDDPRVRLVIDRLTRLVLQLGSVNAVAEALSRESGEVRIYPNRLHGLLADDPGRSVNTATLEFIERGLLALESGRDETAKERIDPARVRQAVAAEVGLTGDHDQGIARVADGMSLPAGVIRNIVGDTPPPARLPPLSARGHDPDWSWQDEAIERAVRALKKSPRYKAGLVIPTGGGKTRIALKIALRILSEATNPEARVLWVTHRRQLHKQARRTLQRLLSENDPLPESASKWFTERIQFVMIQELASALAESQDKLVLVIVDEAHHAAAPSYGALFENPSAPALFLTATPVRRDALPIGVEEVCYTISYRELFKRGCLVEPIFEPALTLDDLDWAQPEGLRDLADYLIDRTDSDFRKTLVVVTQQVRAEVLYDALQALLIDSDEHSLTPDDVAFVHGSRTSAGTEPNDFLDEFVAWPRGILIATGQLVGEGFDDPGIDAVVITYPSSSLGHLMQVAGRALRIRPGKDRAHVVQVRESPLEYYFEQRWLYQDISDALRPALIDLTYSNQATLRAEVAHQLTAHRVAEPVVARVLSELEGVPPGETVHLMLTGLHYWESVDSFDSAAPWGAVLVPETMREPFLQIFNQISASTEDIKEADQFLLQWIRRELAPGSLWKSYVDLVHAMEYARREIQGTEYANAASRPYRKSIGTTWLRYITLTYLPRISPELEAFLGDVVNRAAILAEYETRSEEIALATKIELPLMGSFAYLLTAAQARWFEQGRERLLLSLANTDPLRSFEVLDTLRREFSSSPIPLRLVSEFRQFLRMERYERQVLKLVDAAAQQGTTVPEVEIIRSPKGSQNSQPTV